MMQDWVITSSGGSTGHPRKYSSYRRKYRDDVIGNMFVETFFYRSSGLVADIFHLCERGYFKQGYKVDIAILDPKALAPVANFQNPAEQSQGVGHFFVNAEAIISGGRLNPVLLGKTLTRCDQKD